MVDHLFFLWQVALAVGKPTDDKTKTVDHRGAFFLVGGSFSNGQIYP